MFSITLVASTASLINSEISGVFGTVFLPLWYEGIVVTVAG